MQLSKVILLVVSLGFVTTGSVGCAALASLAGGAGSLVSSGISNILPPGIKLADEPEGLSLSSNRDLPYEVRPSNKNQMSVDASKLYGIY